MTVALLNSANSFVVGQRLVDGSNSRELSTASIGGVEPQGNITALSVGELYIHAHSISFHQKFDVYVAKAKTDRDWILLSGTHDLSEMMEHVAELSGNASKLYTTLVHTIRDLDERMDLIEGGDTSNVIQDIEKLKEELERIEALIPPVVDEEALSLRIKANTDKLAQLTESVDSDKLELVKLKNELAAAIERIVALETAEPEDPEIPVDPNPSKFYVLPLGGQSNMVGYGEVPHAGTYLADIDSRIKQIGRGASWDGHTPSSSSTAYGSRFDELRGSKQDKEVIPATPCLDHAQNMFQHNVGGTVGAGLYIAKELLKYVPNDYGILIVPCAYGGTSFSDGNWNTNSGLGPDMMARIKHAMDVNSANKLLPIVWTQGEMDANGATNAHALAHLNSFKSFIDWAKVQLADYAARAPYGIKWFCCSPTKWALNADEGTSFVNHPANYNGDFRRLSCVYDGYAYLANTRDDVFAVDIMVKPDGNFTPTNREQGNGSTTSTRQIHFSSVGYKEVIAPIVANAILVYAMQAREKNLYTRKIHGGCGEVKTDHVSYEYTNLPPQIGQHVANHTSLDSFGIKFDINPTTLRDQTSYLFASNPFSIRWETGMLTVIKDAIGVYVSAFYSGAWEGDWNDTQEVVITYNKDVRELHLYLNGKLVDSVANVAPFRLTQTVTIGTPEVVQQAISGLVVFSL